MSNLLHLAVQAAEHAGRAGGWRGPGWFFFPLIWIALLAVVIWLVARRREPTAGTPVDRAVEILAARYARGEIDTEEYRHRLDQIRGLT